MADVNESVGPSHQATCVVGRGTPRAARRAAVLHGSDTDAKRARKEDLKFTVRALAKQYLISEDTGAHTLRELSSAHNVPKTALFRVVEALRLETERNRCGALARHLQDQKREFEVDHAKELTRIAAAERKQAQAKARHDKKLQKKANHYFIR